MEQNAIKKIIEGEEPNYFTAGIEKNPDNNTAEKCKWCEGSGIDREGLNVGNPYPCTECKGIGFKHGEEGKRLYFKQMDEAEKELIEKGLL